MIKRCSHFTSLLIVLLIFTLGISSVLFPGSDISVSERRKLAQKPLLTAEGLYSGEYMRDYEKYAVDRFIGRDFFRSFKAILHYRVFCQTDNNGIYLVGNQAAKLEYPLNEASLSNACAHFRHIYDNHLKEKASRIYFVCVPDKGYYLARPNGYPSLDYDRLFSTLEYELPFAEFITITDTLSIDSYYHTDTHWRQETLTGTAARILASMGKTFTDDFTRTALSTPFYGVYYGQAALPMQPDSLTYFENAATKAARVYRPENNTQTTVYDTPKLSGRDPYEFFLSGAAPVLTIHSPLASKRGHLIVFRDSFAGALLPLFLGAYSDITMIDTRYLSRELLKDYVDFSGADVLFLYSTLLLNNSFTLK